MAMTITPPILIDESKIIDSNILEFEIPEWVSTTEYSRDDEVTYGKSIYVCVVVEGSTSTGEVPDVSNDWSRKGPSNYWAMFDGKIGTSSNSNNTFMWDGVEYNGLYIEVSPLEVYTSLTLFGLVGSKIFLRVEDGTDGVLLDKTIDTIRTDDIGDWFEYFSEPIELINDLYVGDLPAYRTATIKLGIVSAGSGASLSAFLVGREITLGDTRFGVRFGITDYSIKNRDQFGESDILERGFSKNNSFELRIDRGRVDFVQKTLARYRATPIVYRVLEEFEATLVYGFFKDFQIVLPGLNISRCNIDIEGLNEL